MISSNQKKKGALEDQTLELTLLDERRAEGIAHGSEIHAIKVWY